MKSNLLRFWDFLLVLISTGVPTLYITKTASKELFSWIYSVKFLYFEALLCVYAGTCKCYLNMLDKQERWVCWIVGPALAVNCDPLVHLQNLVILRLFYMYSFEGCFISQ